MYKNKKIVVVTPSGRSRYQKLLFEYIKRNRSIVDEYVIWQNTDDKNDISWFNEINRDYDWVSIKYAPSIGSFSKIGYFYRFCRDSDAIYIKLDDDIVYIDNHFFSNLVQYRYENPQFLIVSANTINNSICSYIHNQNKIIDIPKLEFDCCSRLWKHGELAKKIHEQFISEIINKDTDKYKFAEYKLPVMRFSINAVSWFGEDFQNHSDYILEGVFEKDDEQFLTEFAPTKLQRFNSICGNAICSHFAYWTQRIFLDSTDLLQKYVNVLERNSCNDKK